MRNFILAACMAVISLDAVGGAQAANDEKNYAGLECVKVHNKDGFLNEEGGKLWYNNLGEVLNNSSSKSLLVACPIIRDKTDGDIDQVKVRIIDDSPDVLKCRLRAQTRVNSGNGTSFEGSVGHLIKTNRNSPHTTTLELGSINQNHDYFYKYWFECRIPKRNPDPSFILSYWVKEGA